MDKGIDAERAVFANRAGQNTLDEFKTRTPHQGAVAEYPEVTCREFRNVQRNRGHPRTATRKRSELNAFCC